MASTANLDPYFKPWAEWLVDVGRYLELNPRITSGFRSLAKQQQLYDRYLRGVHRYPVAPPGASLHNYGLAVDLVSDDNERLGAIWRQYGGCWGAAKDPIHFAAACSVRELG